jgi:hypothetical protein
VRSVAQQVAGADAGNERAFTPRQQRRGTARALGIKPMKWMQYFGAMVLFALAAAKGVGLFVRNTHGVSDAAFTTKQLVYAAVFGGGGVALWKMARRTIQSKGDE